MIDIRLERPEDVTGAREVIRRAFNSEGEVGLVDLLRGDGMAIASVVAVIDGAVAGHALFSRLELQARGVAIPAAALAPVAVLPGLQRRGIGTRLIEFGLQHCLEAGVAAVLVLGDPAYYERFGFSVAAAAGIESPYAGPHFMGLELFPGCLADRPASVTYPVAFSLVD